MGEVFDFFSGLNANLKSLSVALGGGSRFTKTAGAYRYLRMHCHTAASVG